MTSIGYRAFENCTGLTSVTIGNGVTSIGDYAFYGCTGLTSIAIPDSVTSIGYRAFENCTGLTSVTIGNGVTSIDDYAFYGCSNLESITLPFVGANLNGSSNTHLGYIFGAGSYSSNNQYVPQSLKTVVITVTTSIENYAFYGCTGLTSVTIGNSVTSIGDSAFEKCTGLTSITISDSVTRIGYNAFYGCTGLTSVHITDIVAWCKISFNLYGANPLSYAHNLYLNGELVTDLVIPNSVTSIHATAFAGCTGLTSVTIGNGVTSIGDSAFSGCTGLTSVHITDIAAWCKISFGAPYASGSYYTANPLYYAHNLYLNGELVTELVIPDSVTSIGATAFYGCTGLTSITIPDSVTSIGYYAFAGCTGLKSITFTGTKAQWNAIDKGSNWNGNTGAYTIHCTDGDISK